jgi:hypothetical protein
MILEGVVIFFVIGFIAVLFYKQANEQFEILQLEANRLHELPTLYSDHSPIVVRGFTVPNIANFEQLVKRKHIMQMALAPKRTLYSTLTDPNQLEKWTFVPATTEFLAKESGLHVWFQMNIFTKLLPSPYTTWMYSFKTYLYPHHRGLFKTTAFQTIIMPTQGQARISVILQNAEAYFPTKWKEKQFHHLSTQDTPLLSQIQFVEIKLKKGNLLFLPSHLIIDVTTDTSEKEDCWFMMAEIHHPISKLASI